MSAGAPAAEAAGLIRHLIRVEGIVQGVGFRPYVQRLAAELDLAGWVANDSGGVRIDIQGAPDAVAGFEHRLAGEAPPLARIDRVHTSVASPAAASGFRIVVSQDRAGARTFVSPDVAVCDDCLGEMRNPADRRYRYPLINCTNCGPRFTITLRLPYDRPNTTMGGFSMCDGCAREYHDPSDRRFHAQPVGCAGCGPVVWAEPDGERGEAAIKAAQAALRRGEIVAVKGVGGYHLACDATQEPAVSELRRRKGRPSKPFAVMVPDLDAAGRVASITPAAAGWLTGIERPIVLVPPRPDGPIAPSVAPGNPYVGLMLPYTPLHYLLFEGPTSAGALVMTSGNLSDEPLCYDDADARTRLGRIADRWLVHDRPVHVPCDDSVVLADGDRQIPVRRSRGYAPVPIRLPFDVPPTLAVGGEVKNTFCLATGRAAWMSQHLGDMGSVATLAAFERSVEQFSEMYGVDPEVVAVDPHPGYLTRAWAERHSRRPPVEVQHHHAHVAALMAEHRLGPEERVIGFAFDGTGYGSDGTIWGGEVLIAGYRAFERAAHLRSITTPGGDRVVRRPYLAALAHLHAAGIGWPSDLEPVAACPDGEQRLLGAQLEGRLPATVSSSMGRLFDAVSALLGLRQIATHEAQAAVELESRAAGHVQAAPRYRFDVDGPLIDPAPVLAGLIADVRRGRDPGPLAAGFHVAVAAMVADVACRVRGQTGLSAVGLTGGVFQNALLLRLAQARLAEAGFRVLIHRVVPPNDGGLALGQAAVAGLGAVGKRR